ncbi:MAG: MBL fold metallo-hydrolase [Reyranellaceae bacterium]
MSITLSFHGAAGTVTGSCYLIEHEGGRLLVDCGMFQGSKTLRELNYGPFPFDPASIDHVLLTHAHIDHSGLVPKLVRLGYGGRVLCTEGTRDLLAYMLPDSGAIQEIDVERLNRRNAQRGRPPVEPIYTRAQAEAALKQIEGVGYGKWFAAGGGVRARFWDAAHILGSASIELEIAASDGVRRLLFSGDIGPGSRPLKAHPTGPTGFDLLVMESTYGDTDRPELDETARRAALRREVKLALKRGGNLMIPVFAIERTQELLYDLAGLIDAGELPAAPVFLDSPLAARATEVFAEHARERPGGARVAQALRRRNFRVTESVEQSKAIGRVHGGAIIMAGSGMCEGGRIRHHLKANLWRPDATLLLVGFQAAGTLGRVILDGAPAVRIHGEEVAVKAAIRNIDVYSGHADRSQLADWACARAGGNLTASGRVFLTHGEAPAAAGLRKALIGRGFDRRKIAIAAMDQKVRLEPGRIRVEGADRPRVAPQEAGRPDWHNRYAATLLALSDRLRQMPDDAAREALLDRLRDDLRGGARRTKGSGR